MLTDKHTHTHTEFDFTIWIYMNIRISMQIYVMKLYEFNEKYAQGHAHGIFIALKKFLIFARAISSQITTE